MLKLLAGLLRYGSPTTLNSRFLRITMLSILFLNVFCAKIDITQRRNDAKNSEVIHNSFDRVLYQVDIKIDE